MIITEILKKESPNIKQSKKEVSDFVPRKKHAVLGVGAQAIAYMHTKFPNKVIKTVQINGSSDPVYQFLRLCMNHQDNPFLPKIYGSKQFTSKEMDYDNRDNEFVDISNTDYMNGEPPPNQRDFTLYIAMERLKRVHMLNNDMLRDMGIVIPRFDIETRAEYQRWVESRRGQVSMTDYEFRSAFDDYDSRRYMFTNSTNPKFKQVLRLLEPLFNHFDPDMHTGNIMLRGQQLVIVDPVTHN